MAALFSLLAALIHFLIFILESVTWGQKLSNKAFKTDAKTAEINRNFAYNQGFYNLFLGLGALVGSILSSIPTYHVTSTILITYSCLSMLGAAIVLLSTSAKMWRAALIQGGPPFLALAVIFYEYFAN